MPAERKEKFCPRCGRELPKAQAAKQKNHSRRKAPVIAAVVLLAAAGAGFLSWKFLWGEPARIQREAAKRYELCMEIHQQVDEIIAPYLEGEESFEYDEEILTQAAEDVYAYAQTLEEQGTIEGSAMCREDFLSPSFCGTDPPACTFRLLKIIMPAERIRIFGSAWWICCPG